MHPSENEPYPKVYLTACEESRAACAAADAFLTVLPAGWRDRLLALRQPRGRLESAAAAALLFYALAQPPKDSSAVAVSPVWADDSLFETAADVVRHVPLTVATGAYGKPFPEGFLWEECRWYPSFSHSRAVAALALSTEPVGVDVQRILAWDAPHTRRVLARVTHPEEQAAFDACRDAGELSAAFCRLWVRKESALKLTGEGMTRALSAVCCASPLSAAKHTLSGRLEPENRRIRQRLFALPDAWLGLSYD